MLARKEITSPTKYQPTNITGDSNEKVSNKKEEKKKQLNNLPELNQLNYLKNKGYYQS